MFVRKLTEEEGEALWTLRLRALTDNPEAFATTYEETLASGRERLVEGLHQEEAFYVGAFEHGLIGMVFFRREEGCKNRHKGRILGMYVQPESRGQGVGKALLQEAITQARRLDGVEQLHLTVVTANAPALSLYHSMGFEVYGTIQRALKMDEQYWDEVQMALRWQ
jgi:ribosomal protein S18 acetylase RimI-like enzyme